MAGHVISVAMALCGRYITPTPHDIINYHSLYHPLAILRREVCAANIASPLVIARTCILLPL